MRTQTARHANLLVATIVAINLCVNSADAGKYDPVTVQTDSPRYGIRATRHASTASQGALDGIANLIGATGEAAHDLARARVENQRARRLAIQNDYRAVAAWHVRRKLRNDVVHAERRSRAAARKPAQHRAPTVETTAKSNTPSGAILWPRALRSSDFESTRWRLELAIRDRVIPEIRTEVTSMRTQLRQRIRRIASQDYLEAIRFLAKLETTQVVSTSTMVATNY